MAGVLKTWSDTLRGWRTILLHVLSALVMTLQVTNVAPLFADAWHAALFTIAVNTAATVLRLDTKGPVPGFEPKDDGK